MNHFRLYIREASPMIQLFLLIAVTLFAAGIVGAVGLLAIKTLYGAEWEQIAEYIADPSIPGAVGTLKMLQLFNAIAVFLIPAMLFSQLFSPQPNVFLRLNRGTTWLKFAVIAILFVVFTPITDALTWVNDSIHLPGFLGGFEDSMRSSADDQQKLIGAFLQMDHFGSFLYTLFLMAVLPAIGEEFFFRGIVQRLLIRKTNRVHLSVWVTGFAFAMMHQQFIAIIPLTVLGALLGYMKEWTGTLWASILAHFVNNASIIVVMYFFQYNMSDLDQLSEPNLFFLVAGIAASAALIFFLFKNKSEPLMENDDIDLISLD